MALQAEDVPIVIALASAEIPAPERHESRRVGFIDTQGLPVHLVVLFYGSAATRRYLVAPCWKNAWPAELEALTHSAA
jgi:hypothetical protein